MSRLFPSGGQSIGASASALVLLMKVMGVYFNPFLTTTSLPLPLSLCVWCVRRGWGLFNTSQHKHQGLPAFPLVSDPGEGGARMELGPLRRRLQTPILLEMSPTGPGSPDIAPTCPRPVSRMDETTDRHPLLGCP